MRDTRIHLYPVEVCSLSNHNPDSRVPITLAGRDQTTTRLQSHLRTRSAAPRSRSLLRPILVLSFRAHDGARRNDAVFDKTPECNRELASQGDNADLANPRTVFTAGAPIPFGQSAARLIAQPTPG